MWYRGVKRTADVVLSGLGLLVLALPLAIVALLIYVEDPGPVIFKQQRVGKNKSLFSLYKFRSMRLDTPHDTPTHLLEHPERYILKVGGFLRKMSIDELPQLWNIFTGDMSIIGERDIIVTTKKNIVFSRVVAANSVSL